MNRRLIPVTDVTLDMLLKEEQKILARQIRNRELIVTRLAMGLINMDTGEGQKCHYVPYNGNTYLYRYWPSRKDEAEIFLEVIDTIGACIKCGRRNEYQDSAYTCWECENGQ
jgi:hypothetical protein